MRWLKDLRCRIGYLRPWNSAFPWRRCECCHARNTSVSDWSFKIRPTRGNSTWMCGECGFGLCNFDCHGVPWRRRERVR